MLQYSGLEKPMDYTVGHNWATFASLHPRHMLAGEWEEGSEPKVEMFVRVTLLKVPLNQLDSPTYFLANVRFKTLGTGKAL